jgi:nitroimidazol reductase NimA-like FMN-containing flavoprotein (pyridoxamine 5'-phosphate oxidase superfamily)
MRRTDKEIQDPALIAEIIAKAQVCRLALCKDGQPYLVPLSFGYDGACLFFHTAGEGMKLDYLAANPRVCFELEHDVRILPGQGDPCAWAFSFYSVIGFGTVEEILEPAAKRDGLNWIMRQYSGQSWEFRDQAVAPVRVWRIRVKQLTGKRSKDKIAG